MGIQGWALVISKQNARNLNKIVTEKYNITKIPKGMCWKQMHNGQNDANLLKL